VVIGLPRRVTVVGGERLTGELLALALRRHGLFEAAWHDDQHVDELVDEHCLVLAFDPAPSTLRACTDQRARTVAVVSTPVVATDDELGLVMGGADAVVPAETPTSEVIQQVELVGHGGASLTPARLRVLLDRVRQRSTRVTSSRDLTRRERQILLSIDRGESVKQTARSLGISPKTVENLQSRLFSKLDVRNRAQAVSHAHGLGLLDGSAVDAVATQNGA
jgi:DNA-binding NarL/FixJ family response regulator